ncbi:ABC transporter permease [Fulvivirga lutimaris]|uniref:ABC transporter permease n=1 Tax=Fulvivirga lutimaris TaxID=1819566 RepID=UPI0012BC42E3|nr:ABC transporter permease [Fulvivirga lutimaris]MTI40402.1 ABC transporter permease [Fulvivirga lutimaris]
MLKNHLKIAFRLIHRNPSHAIINVLGLTVGLVTSIFVWIYVSNEINYDRFNDRSEDIYRVQYDSYYQGEKIYSSATAFPTLGKALKDEYSQVEQTTRIFAMYGTHALRYDAEAFSSSSIYFAEQSFFDIFNLKVLKGNENYLLNESNTAVLSSDMANELFGHLEVVGETLVIDRGIEVKISGVVETRKDSHISFDILVSYPTGVQVWGEGFENDWDWSFFYVYLKLHEGQHPNAVEKALPELIKKYGGDKALETTVLSLQPLTDIHLNSNLIYEFKVNGSAQNVLIIFISGIATLILAWINFINLSSAQAVTRAKEIGIKKINGASRLTLIKQFLVESFLISSIALFFAILLVDISYPLFNQLSSNAFQIESVDLLLMFILLLIFYVGGSILAAVYPAFILSGKKVTHIVKGDFKYSYSGVLTRKALIVFQFSISSLLIGGMIIAQSQVDFMLSEEKGVDIDNTIVLSAPVLADDSTYFKHLDVFRNDLNSIPNIKALSTSSEIPGNSIFYWVQETNFNHNEDDKRLLYTIDVDHNYLESFGHNLVAGRLFSESQDESENLILTVKAAKVLGYLTADEALGKRVYIEDYDSLSVIGVVSDYHQQGMQQGHAPIAFYCDPEFHLYYSIKLENKNFESTLQQIEERYASLFPNNSFDYFFLDDKYQQQYKSEMQFSSIFSIFSMLSLIVASIGILGLVVVSISQRSKEIGIRKLLGATVLIIVKGLSKRFIVLIVLSNAIAAPLVFYIGTAWLDNFAYHIEISPIIFLVTSLITIGVALITISVKTIKSALQNPVNALRSQ